jgi:hypothetical protein
VIASKQNYIIGAKDSTQRKGPCFPTAPPCIYFFLEIYFEVPHEKTCLLSPSVAALIRVLKVYFLFGASKYISRKKKHGMAKGKQGHFQYC